MTQKQKGLSWGVGVWLLFGGFVLFILACVGFASMQRFDLVEDEYYERGVEYQQQIDKQQRTQALATQPAFHYSSTSRSFEVTFPDDLDAHCISGTLTLYRPSNSSYDNTANLELGDSRTASIPTHGLQSGLWKAKLDWQYEDKGYYSEHSFVIE